ncbi:transcriptional regulators of sugar metabolism, DeoR family [Arthrobacter sp. PAMC 25486]|uniref:DeoR/GlpR family DNA-binding transcription regulator n=1 Tax=Arthrobacter sp. PAMC 25486 TaxID=1494608 RepID=UPI000535B5FD|nr:DeoR/GlpR family DNA-binding transcription regulator [Arthrobacter sp. PAMC 25486]AIY02117.1 transcriptional regulators of sugar metabolism, DeoR family [Arthrobacter sp. PAMC 25486]
MFAEERHLRTAELVSARGRVGVNELAELFSVTQETVRRDLAALEEAGQLRRVHGGAVGTDRLTRSELSLTERQTQHLDEKQRIATAALALIPHAPTASILLDSGTTTAALAERLDDWIPANDGDELLVITNSLPTAASLSTNKHLLLDIVGGRVRGLTSAVVGARATEQLGALRPDIAFIGTNGIHAGFGLSTPDPVEAATKTAMVRAARQVVVLADASKLGAETLVRFATLEEIDTLITTAEPSAELAAALAAAGVEVVIA